MTADRDTKDGEYVSRDTCATHLPEEAAAHRRYLDESAPDANTLIGRIVV